MRYFVSIVFGEHWAATCILLVRVIDHFFKLGVQIVFYLISVINWWKIFGVMSILLSDLQCFRRAWELHALSMFWIVSFGVVIFQGTFYFRSVISLTWLLFRRFSFGGAFPLPWTHWSWVYTDDVFADAFIFLFALRLLKAQSSFWELQFPKQLQIWRFGVL
jgi:hypothetical protein